MVGRLIFSNMLQRPVRTTVAVFSVALEVALVLLVVGLTTGMLTDSAKRVEAVGAEIMVRPPGASIFLGIGASPMPVAIGASIKNLPHVQQVAPVLLEFNPRSGGLNVIYGIDMASFDEVSGGFVYYSGAPFQNQWDVLVDDTYARANHVKVGDTVDLLNHKFHICGVVEHGKGGRLFIPLSTAQQITGETARANLFFVKCTAPGYTDEVLASIRRLFPSYQVISVREYMTMVTSNSMPALTDFVRGMIGIAVGSGLLVIFLSMYTTIAERTREIGMLKSLGASKPYLVRLFLGEAGLMAVVGIALGYAGTLAVMRLIVRYFPTLTVQVTADWAVRAAVLALIGALIGALYPALRAASLDPVDSLAHE